MNWYTCGEHCCGTQACASTLADYDRLKKSFSALRTELWWDAFQKSCETKCWIQHEIWGLQSNRVGVSGSKPRKQQKHNCSETIRSKATTTKKSEVKSFCMIAHRTVKLHRERITCTAKDHACLLPHPTPLFIITQSFLIGQIELSRGHLFNDHIIMKWKEWIVFFYQCASWKNPDFIKNCLNKSDGRVHVGILNNRRAKLICNSRWGVLRIKGILLELDK